MHNKESKSKRLLTLAMAALILVSASAASIMTGCGEEESSAPETSETVVITRDDNGVYTDKDGNILTESQIEEMEKEQEVVRKDSEGNVIDSESSYAEGSDSNTAETIVVIKNDNGTYTDESGKTLSETEVKKLKKNNTVVEKDEKGNVVKTYYKDSSSESSNKSSESSSKSSDSKLKPGNSSSSSKSESSEASSKTENKSSDSGNNSSSSDNDSSESSQESSKTEESSDNKPDDNKSSDTLNLDGESVKVGDTVRCVYSIKSPEDLENFQAVINYDAEYLSVTKAKLIKPAASGGIINYKPSGRVLFNGISLSGYEYTEGGEFVEVIYNIKAAGKTTTNVNWQVVTGLSGKAYASGGDTVNGLTYSKEYTVQ